ncbi:MAG: hypothetical protein MUF33_01085 [Candidatus Nanopelagicales bacterium]|jgi:hypothetical protein|nr:hypothetical protein [Candidatus Nanopelagicales bacterium]MCU0295679.1 hypothetical protein [Candidatus Nanopelagicales bacterium]MCU0297093.1 hypothetical protein [Candidatus Nanopelagicales bacterium]
MAETLEDLPYEELRHRAFELAEKRHDIGFFYDLLTHTPSLDQVSDEGGSLGDISGSLVGLINAAKEAFGHEQVGELEPLFVARFATYIREHGGQ